MERISTKDIDNHWIRFKDIKKTKTFKVEELRADYCAGGFHCQRDGGIAAAKLIITQPNDDNIYLLGKYWVSQNEYDAGIKARRLPYSTWYNRGLLKVLPDYFPIGYEAAEWFENMIKKLGIYPKVIAKSGSSTYLGHSYYEREIGRTNALIHVVSKELKWLLINGRLNYNNNTIDTWSFANAHMKIPNAFEQCGIEIFGPLEQRKKITGAMAAINALAVLHAKRKGYRLQ